MPGAVDQLDADLDPLELVLRRERLRHPPHAADEIVEWSRDARRPDLRRHALEETVGRRGLHPAADVLPPELGDDAAPRRALQEAELEKVRLVHVLDRVRLLAERDGERRETHGPAAELEEHRLEKIAVGSLQAELVHLEELERLARDRQS